MIHIPELTVPNVDQLYQLATFCVETKHALSAWNDEDGIQKEFFLQCTISCLTRMCFNEINDKYNG